MCYQIKCNVCNKTAWGGCGKHLDKIKREVSINDRCNHVKWD